MGNNQRGDECPQGRTEGCVCVCVCRGGGSQEGTGRLKTQRKAKVKKREDEMEGKHQGGLTKDEGKRKGQTGACLSHPEQSCSTYSNERIL